MKKIKLFSNLPQLSFFKGNEFILAASNFCYLDPGIFTQLLILIVFLAIFISTLGRTLFFFTFTFLFPMLQSVKINSRPNLKALKKYLIYWLIYSFLHCFYLPINYLFIFKPFFYLTVQLFLVFLLFDFYSINDFIYDQIISAVFRTLYTVFDNLIYSSRLSYKENILQSKKSAFPNN